MELDELQKELSLLEKAILKSMSEFSGKTGYVVSEISQGRVIQRLGYEPSVLNLRLAVGKNGMKIRYNEDLY